MGLCEERVIEIYGESNIEELIKEMEKFINKIPQMSKEDSLRLLFEAGIVNENGELLPQYRKDE